jgi:predicted RNA-binding protein with PIN domain
LEVENVPRRWLIDGMNVIGSRPDGWWNDPDRAIRNLIDELNEFRPGADEDVTVVFDRRPRDLLTGPHGEVNVVFASRRGRNAADHDIVEMVADDRDPRSITVVTSDARLKERVQELGAEVMTAGVFRGRLDRVAPLPQARGRSRKYR